MAADAGERTAALRDLRRGIVRAARAKIGRPGEWHHVAAKVTFLGIQESNALGNLGRSMKAGDAISDNPRDLGWCKLAVRWQNPFSILIKLADNPWADVRAPIVELLFELVLDDRALFFHDDDLFESLGKAPDPLAFERPGHRDFVNAYTDVRGMHVVNPEIVEGLAHIKIGFAGGHNAETWPRAIDDHTVEAVCASKSECCVKLVSVQSIFLIERLVWPTDIESSWRHLKIIGLFELKPRRADLYRGRAIDGLGDGLESDPATRIARHRPAIEAEVEQLLHSGRV